MKLPKIAQNSAIYIVFNVLQRAINFFLLPLYTIYLTPEDYGITNVLTSTTALLTFLLTFSLQAASIRFHFKYSKSNDLVKKIWGSNLVFIIFNSFFWAGIILLTYNYLLRHLIGDDISFMPFVLMSIVSCCFSPLYLYFQRYLQTTQQAKFFVINNLAYFIVQVSLTIVFVVFFRWRAAGVIAAGLIVNVIFAIYALFSLRKYITYCFSKRILTRSLKYSVPLIPHSLSGWLNGMLDRIFINKFANLASVGLYSISYQFGLVINMLGFGINQAYSPWFMKNHSTKNGVRKIVEVSDLAIAAITIIAFLLSIFSKEILAIMTTKNYHSVWFSIVILSFANLLDGMYYFYVAVLYLEKTKVLSAISISCSIMVSIINIFSIKQFGYIGAAYSFFLIQIVNSLIVRYYAAKFRPDISFNSKRHYFQTLIALLTVIVSLYIIKDVTILGAGIKVLVSILFSFFIFYINREIIVSTYKAYVKKEL